MMSIFSPFSSWTMACTRMPRGPTQAPTGSTFGIAAAHHDLERLPASRATARISTIPS